uniref:Phosphatidylinositol-specific phospholipase C X domain-containing protein n=1 Tax=Astyanax mexicanus TaxID=7994 RepID=A0A3B1IKX9_ASTMX
MDDTTNEDWMSTLPEELWDLPLTSLAIPGSHDAMSYCLDITSPLVRSESSTLKMLDRLGVRGLTSCQKKYINPLTAVITAL